MLAVFGLLAAACGDDESGDAESADSAALDQARAEAAAAQAEADASAAQADAAAAEADAAAAQAEAAAAAAAEAEAALAAAMAEAASSEGVDPAVVADLENQLAAAQAAAADAEAEAAEAAAAAEAAMAAMAAAEDMAEEEMAGAELGEITTIQLIANPWNGSAANIAVAAQLLEHIGYEVEVTDLDENAQWSAINTGELHASLEVWPSGHAQNRVDFIDNPAGNVADAGLLGPVGKIGWWMPAYMVERHPELATWEGFQDPELAGLFATAETGDLGQILHGDPSWVTYEQNIIDNLGLQLELVYAGSEEALLASFDAAFAREDPVLSYFWTPHSAFKSFDLVEVQLPEYTDECGAQAETGGYNCDYPADNLFKIAWAGLEEGAPAAWALLQNFNYTTADQVSMLAAIEGEGKSVEEAAADWIAANEATWSAWIPS